MLQLILDCTKLVPNILPDKRHFLLKTESHARLLRYKLHFKRRYLHKTHQRRLREKDGCQFLLLPIYITKQNLSEPSGQPIQWIPRVPIHRRNIQQQQQQKKNTIFAKIRTHLIYDCLYGSCNLKIHIFVTS